MNPASPACQTRSPRNKVRDKGKRTRIATNTICDEGLALGTYTRIFVRVTANTGFGEEIRCSGASFAMGQYNPNESTTLVTTPKEYPVWSTLKPLILPRGVPHRYMYAIFSGGEFQSWESIAKERLIIPEGNEMTIEETFGQDNYDVQLSPVGGDIYRRESTGSMELSGDSPTNRSGASSTSPRYPFGKKKGFKRYVNSTFKPKAGSTVVLVCYHLPVTLSKSVDGKWQAEWNRDSIIAKSDHSISEDMKVFWVGAITHESLSNPQLCSTDEDISAIKQLLYDMCCVPLFIDQNLADTHYGNYCKEILWPLLHNVDVLDIHGSVWKPEGKRWDFDRGTVGWEAYQTINMMFARAVTAIINVDDIIWVHDYHLFLLPSYIENLSLEKGLKRPHMVFFLHVPFPTSEIFRSLPIGPDLLRGVLSVDVVGFHSFDHARHFLNACKRFLGLSYQSRQGGNLGVNYHGRNVVVTISHIGIETEHIQRGLSNPEIERGAQALREKYPGKILICGVDACQRLAGVPLKLLAFEQLIKQYPIWRDNVVLVQRCITGSFRLGDQDHSSKEIRTLVQRITDNYGNCVDYEESSSFGLKDRLKLWLACDIMLVMVLREGLNLKPLEYVFARESFAGVVVLSEFSACCCVLNGALRVNPWNLAEVVNSLDHALTMGHEERQGRRARDLPYITNKTASSWTRQVLSVLQEGTEDEDAGEYTDLEYPDTETFGSHVVRTGDSADFKELDISKVVQAYRSTKRRIFLLDYGGTIISRENMSMYKKKDFTAVTGRVPTPRVMKALELLGKDKKNTVFVVSGVSQTNLTSVLGHISGIGLAAQSGAMYCWADNWDIEADGETSVQKRDRTESLSTLDNHKNLYHRHWDHLKYDFDWEKVKELAHPLLQAYTTRTNGSVLKYFEQGVAWNFRSTDPEWGLLQANQLQTDLEEVLKDLPVAIVRKKGLLEIVPEGLHKGVVARQILSKDAIRHKGHPDFVFCIGDDSTDESMFKAIYQYMAERSEESVHGGSHMRDDNATVIEGHLQHVFTCTVGKKPSNAHLYVNEVSDVVDVLVALSEASAE